MVETFDTFYERVKVKVINLIKKQEIAESNLHIDNIMSDVIKQMIFEDLDIKVKTIIPRDIQNYPVKRVLYRDDSKLKIDGTLTKLK